MQIEELYRAAIVALRNRQWEQATRNLLTVVNVAPQHRDAARVLMQLERLRPVSYWRGTFMFAIERSAWDQAEAAAAKLNEIDPALHNANDVASRLQELTAIGWYLPQAPEGPPPTAPEPTPDATPPPDSEAWLQDLARRQEEQSLAHPDLADVITPRTLEIPLDRLVALDQAEGWPAPESSQAAPDGEWQPPREPLLEMGEFDDLGPSSEDADEYTTPRALKAMGFSEAVSDVGMESLRGPIYDTLSTPRALKTAAFMDKAASAETAAAARPLAPMVEPVPEDATATAPVPEPPPALPPEPAQEPPESPVEIEAPPRDEPPSLSDAELAQPYHPPVTASVDATQPYQAPQAEGIPAPMRRRVTQPRHRLTVAAIVALLIVMLALIARLARNMSTEIPASLPPATTPAENGDSDKATSEIPALIASLDVVLAPSGEVSQTTTALDQLRDQIEALTPLDSPLREALLTWLDAGQQRQATWQQMATACSKTSPDPGQCATLQTEYDLLDSRTHLARNAVCILAECSDV